MSPSENLDADFGDEAKNVTVGKHNRQTVTEAHAAGNSAVGSHQNVTHVDMGDRGRAAYGGESELSILRHRVDRIEDRNEDTARRVQQIEIALQINTPGRSSHGERMFMLIVIAASLFMLLMNAYIQVVAR